MVRLVVVVDHVKFHIKNVQNFRQQKNVFIVSLEMFGESQVIRTLGGETGPAVVDRADHDVYNVIPVLSL